MIVAALWAGVCGCCGTQGRTITGPSDWSEDGATVALPEGIWLAEWEEGRKAKGKYTVFSEAEGPGRVVFWRVSGTGKAPGWLTLQDLFLDFHEKHELGRWTLPTRGGEQADCAGFVLVVGGRRVFATGCAVAHGAVTYAVIAWGFEQDHSASRRVAESMIESLRLESGD